jgi:hypothetical protein
MADTTVPYVPAYGNITKALDRIKKASTPSRFTQDFLASTLDLKGGSAKPVIPFLKRTGFLASDGSPTDLYKRFRNDTHAGAVAAEALRIGYRPLYEINEQVHDVNDADLRGTIVQATGAENNSSTVKVIVGSFKALRAYADFHGLPVVKEEEQEGEDILTGDNGSTRGDQRDGLPAGIRLGYTINLHLNATSDVAVFNAIFKSLREHLLR